MTLKRHIMRCMETTSADIARNILEERTRRGMSQKSIADFMRRSGHAWSQTVVWKTESGERPLRLVEAVDLANCLELNLWELTRTSKTAVQAKLAAVEDAASRAEDALREYADLRRELMAMPVDDEREEVRGGVEDESARVLVCAEYRDDDVRDPVTRVRLTPLPGANAPLTFIN